MKAGDKEPPMTDPSVRDLVDRALLPLRAVDEALHARAVDYVVDGTQTMEIGRASCRERV